MSAARAGRLTWIGLRPDASQPPRSVARATAVVGQGLDGDHFRGLPGGAGTRQVTLVDAADLLAVGRELGTDEAVDPGLVRRNLVVQGLALSTLRGRRLRVGADVLLEVTGGCPPCRKMELALGPGGRAALHRRGGLTARVLAGGEVRVGDAVEVLDVDADD